MLTSYTCFDKINFNGGNLSSDGGAFLLMEFLISSIAYNLFHIFQGVILENEDQKIMMNTYRIRYQKIAVKVIRHARNISLSFSSAYKKKDTFLRYLNKVIMQS